MLQYSMLQTFCWSVRPEQSLPLQPAPRTSEAAGSQLSEGGTPSAHHHPSPHRCTRKDRPQPGLK